MEDVTVVVGRVVLFHHYRTYFFPRLISRVLCLPVLLSVVFIVFVIIRSAGIIHVAFFVIFPLVHIALLVYQIVSYFSSISNSTIHYFFLVFLAFFFSISPTVTAWPGIWQRWVGSGEILNMPSLWCSPCLYRPTYYYWPHQYPIIPTLRIVLILQITTVRCTLLEDFSTSICRNKTQLYSVLGENNYRTMHIFQVGSLIFSSLLIVVLI